MKPLSLCLACLFLARVCEAQLRPPDEPPTNEEIARYFEVMHVRDSMKNVLESAARETRQLVHEQIKKEAPNATPEFKTQVDGLLALDDTAKNIIVDEMLMNMVPVYQKHFARGDLAALLAFYDTPTGQKLLKEIPAVTQESMQATYSLMEKKMNGIMQKVHEQIVQTQKEAKPKSDQPAAPSTPPAPSPK
jgi:uncharacterized protein